MSHMGMADHDNTHKQFIPYIELLMTSAWGVAMLLKAV